MTVLEPEVFHLIAGCIKDEGGRSELGGKIESQQTLANMMQVSKMMHDICKTSLYDHILVGDIDTLVQDLDPKGPKAALLNRAQELPYVDLITKGAWNVKPWVTNDHHADLERADRDKAFGDKLWHRLAGARLRQATSGDERDAKRDAKSKKEDGGSGVEARQEDRAFANLTHVAMGGLGDDAWSSVRGSQHFETEPPLGSAARKKSGSTTVHCDNRPVPHFFLTLPSVQHYCQGLLAGPLAMAQRHITASNVPRIDTMHPKGFSTQDGMNFRPPIVLGTTNRWMIDAPLVLMSDIEEAVGPSAVNEALDHIAKVICGDRPTFNITHDGINFTPFDSTSDAFANTSIEIYDYILHLFMTDRFAGDDWDPAVGFEGPKFQVSNLKRFQALLDAKIGRWKGKVFLRNGEDCPPCSACGHQGPGAASMRQVLEA